MNNSVQNGKYIELAEHRNYLELSNLVCYYNEANLNGLQLDYGETETEQAETLLKAQTLCLMPVYAKVTVNAKAEPTFAGHEATRKANGEVIYKTIPIGVHESVVIEDREVEVAPTGEMKTLPCLIAKQRIWSRNKNAVAAIKRLFNEGHLHNSFEMEVSQYEKKEGIRHAQEYEFVGNAFLASDSLLRGASVKPAYGNAACVTEIAEEEPDYEYELAQALAADLAENETEEVNQMQVNEMNQTVEASEQTEVQQEETQVVEATEQVEQTEQTVVEETATMTDRDIRRAICKKMEEMNKEHWYEIAFVFPEEHLAWLRTYGMRDVEFVQVAYEVTENDVILSDEQTVEIALSIRELSAAYTKQVEQIENLNKEVAELKPFKEQVEAEIAAAEKAKHEKEVSDLRKLAENAQCFTEEELSAMNDLFEQVKTNDIKAAIFDKKSAMMNKTVETSTTEEEVEQPKANLEQESSHDCIGNVRRFLNI